jgi:hypothetical protein
VVISQEPQFDGEKNGVDEDKSTIPEQSQDVVDSITV